jgi:hypothetical protein
VGISHQHMLPNIEHSGNLPTSAHTTRKCCPRILRWKLSSVYATALTATAIFNLHWSHETTGMERPRKYFTPYLFGSRRGTHFARVVSTQAAFLRRRGNHDRSATFEFSASCRAIRRFRVTGMPDPLYITAALRYPVVFSPIPLIVRGFSDLWQNS